MPPCRIVPPKRALPGSVRRFIAATAGTTAIEVGLLGIPFFMLLLGTVVIAYTAWCSATLDFATQKAARQILTGSAQSSVFSSQQFRTNILCPNLPSAIFDCAKVVVNLRSIQESAEPTAWYKFVQSNRSGLIQPPLDNSQTSFCLGSGNTYQVLEVLYPLQIFTSIITLPGAVADQFNVMSTAAFKNEPFGGSSSQGNC